MVWFADGRATLLPVAVCSARAAEAGSNLCFSMVTLGGVVDVKFMVWCFIVALVATGVDGDRRLCWDLSGSSAIDGFVLWSGATTASGFLGLTRTRGVSPQLVAGGGDVVTPWLLPLLVEGGNGDGNDWFMVGCREGVDCVLLMANVGADDEQVCGSSGSCLFVG